MGTHIIYMFNQSEKYFANAVDFVTKGLDAGDTIFVIEEESTYIEIQCRLLEKGYSTTIIDSIIFESSSKFYRTNTNNDNSAKLTFEKLNEILSRHWLPKKKLRIWGQVLFQNFSLYELREYEKRCDNLLYGKNVLTVCSYNGLLMPAYFQNEMLKVHEYVMVDDQIERSPFYDRKNVVSLSESEVELLRSLEEENLNLKKTNQQLILHSKQQKERERLLELEKQNVQRANDAKKLFLSQMSHDLRTPLNTIQGYSQIIQMDYPNAGFDLHRKVDKIFHASEQLLNIIEQILEFTAIDTDNITYKKEAVFLKPFIEECICSILETSSTEVPIQLGNLEDDMCVEVDPFRLQQILTNLLNNAIKYGDLNGSIVIHCNYLEQGEAVKIDVSDNGDGIPEKELDAIFEPFYRLKNNLPSRQGTGLGLAIVAHLTRRMNGDYGVVSKEGLGSTFWVSFPVIKATHNQMTEKWLQYTNGKKVSSNKKINVLYIEDHKENIYVMESMLQLMEAIELTCVTTGKAGIEISFQQKPQLILLDLSLPDMNGFQVLKTLQSNPITRNTPIVAVSADALGATIERALKGGCVAYITKPINFQELRNIVEQVVAQS